MSEWLPLNGYIQIREIMQYELDQGFVPLFTYKVDERLRGERFAELVRR